MASGLLTGTSQHENRGEEILTTQTASGKCAEQNVLAEVTSGSDPLRRSVSV